MINAVAMYYVCKYVQQTTSLHYARFFKYTLLEKYNYDTEIWVFLQLIPKASSIVI